jgi:hypothetical protein
VGHEKVGDVLLAKGDLVEAQAAYQQSLEIIQRLAASDPLNAGWRRQLSVCLTKIAELYERQRIALRLFSSHKRASRSTNVLPHSTPPTQPGRTM